MKNIRANFFLPILVLIFSGLGQVYAHSCDAAIGASIHPSEKSIQYGNGHNQMIPGLSAKLNQSPIGYRNIKLRATGSEVEEEEVFSSKKIIVSNNYFASYYNSLSASYFTSHIQKGAPFYSFFYHFSPCKIFVVFQVFRL